MSTTALTSTLLNPIWRALGWLSVLLVFFSTNVFAGQVSLAWSASSGPVSGYKVYYGTASGSYSSNMNAGNSTTATVASLTDGSTYYFSVKAYDSAGNESGFSNEVSKPLTVAAPVASFSADKASGTAPVTVNLADTSTGTITSRAWDLGDGTTSTAQSVAKTYSAAGTYTVKLTVTNAGGSTTATKTISVTTSTVAAPVASFSATPTSGTAPLLVTLTDTSTGTISTRTWDLGDSTTSTSQSVAKTYNSAGSYTVKLTVTNSSGSSTTTKTISASASTPVANFTASPTSGVAPLPVTFSNTSTNAVSYSWNFGDGTTSTAQTPATKTYSNAGTYTVTLTATGSSGTTPSTKTQTITVSAASASSASGLVAAYNFEEASGNTVVDASGKGNHGTITEAARTTSGKFGKALSFDGVNDWVTVNDSASLDLTNGMTLEAWVYPAALTGSWRTVVLKEQTSDLTYALYANSGNNVPTFETNNGSSDELLGTSSLSLNGWTHIAATYDGTTKKLYINSKLISSNPLSGSITVSSGKLRIGGNSVWGGFFKGLIDEVRIYNRALSETEIATDMNTSVATSSPSKLLLGAQTVGSVSDSLPQGTAAAFQTTAAVTGQITSLPVYVDMGSASTTLIVGLYANSSGRPGTLLATGTLKSPKVGSWNTVPIPATKVNASTNYWVAILSSNGMLKFRDKVGSTAQPSETSKSTALTSLPNTWSTGTISANGPLSGYGAGY